MIEYVITTALFYFLSKRKKPSLGKLPGTRIKRSELNRKICNKEAGNINNGDWFFDGGILYNFDGEIYVSKEDFKNAIDKTLKNNQNHLRANEEISKILSYNEFFGFDNIVPKNEQEAYYFTILAIANGLKFIWEDQGVRRGLKNEIFGSNVPLEKKNYKNIINKNGVTIEELNERYTLEYDYRKAITDAVKIVTSRKEAKHLLNDLYNQYVYDNIKEQIAYNKLKVDNENDLPFIENEKAPF